MKRIPSGLTKRSSEVESGYEQRWGEMGKVDMKGICLDQEMLNTEKNIYS